MDVPLHEVRMRHLHRIEDAMRPIPIPGEMAVGGNERKVFAAPSGDLTDPDVAPIEMLVHNGMLTSLWVTEGDEHPIDGVVAVTMWANQPPPMALRSLPPRKKHG